MLYLLCDTRHLKPDTWHATHDTWHTGGGEHVLKCQVPCSYGLGKKGVWRYFHKGSVSELINQWITTVLVKQPWLHNLDLDWFIEFIDRILYSTCYKITFFNWWDQLLSSIQQLVWTNKFKIKLIKLSPPTSYIAICCHKFKISVLQNRITKTQLALKLEKEKSISTDRGRGGTICYFSVNIC